jgi:hypothetical protein
MNVVEPPPSQPGDDLDGLLRAFLRSQLPQPWPPSRLHSDVTACRLRPALGRSLMRSRWALAASIALLFFGSWLLPSRLPPNANRERGSGEAIIGSDDIRPDFHQNHKKNRIENKKKPGLAADQDDPMPNLEGSDSPMLN